jgi:hypothetical protein
MFTFFGRSRKKRNDKAAEKEEKEESAHTVVEVGKCGGEKERQTDRPSDRRRGWDGSPGEVVFIILA